ncbi:hypothetical protein EST38_g10912 [Candolleomyces aberdarensis]|uniref:Uncharacterized protein n=1 Tax=Candolleomyces aberdarensis TaxID=2316362 RepID=A0A4V1Q2F9_9AGAR|nr:hypothetical protein EST38_g10912 [Candolleomyces aberdarensis]
MSLPTPIDLFSSTSRTCAEVAKLAGDAAFWTFVQRITRSSIPVHIPIATEIDKVLSEVFYAVGACQEAFNNQGRAIHILRLWPMLIKGTVCLKGSLDKITKEELGSITPKAGSFVIVDSKGTLLAWHIRDVISPRLQRIAEAATLKLNSQAPALLQDGPPDLPSTWHNWSPENPDALMLRSGAINVME